MTPASPNRSSDIIRLAIVTSHPIQYNAPLFQELAHYANIELHVFYSWQGTARDGDKEFGQVVKWDIPLLEGYDYTFSDNVAKDPGSHHFMGLNNPTMVSEIERWNPDLLLVYGWAFNTHLKVIRYFHKKKPIIFRGDSTLMDQRSIIKLWLRKIYLTWVYKHVDYALYPGVESKDYFQHFGLQHGQLHYLPHCIDVRRFNWSPAESEPIRDEKRDKLGISKDAVVFLFVGKLSPRKNPKLLLDAFLTITQDAPNLDIHLVYVGTGVLTEELGSGLSGKDNIHFLGFVNQAEMPSIYYMCDVLVLPSSMGETWGLVVNEAMACGRPVIVSDRVGCADDLVISGKTGEVFKSGSAIDLANKLQKFIDDPRLVGFRGKDARYLINEFSIAKTSQRLNQILSNVITI